MGNVLLTPFLTCDQKIKTVLIRNRRVDDIFYVSFTSGSCYANDPNYGETVVRGCHSTVR